MILLAKEDGYQFLVAGSKSPEIAEEEGVRLELAGGRSEVVWLAGEEFVGRNSHWGALIQFLIILSARDPVKA